MKPVIVIPARMGASRLPGKPMAMIGDKPMIQHTYERALEADLGPVVVACCGNEIATLIRDIGGEAVITDPNLPSGTDRVWAAVQSREEEIIVNLQGDLPFINPQSIKAAVKPFQNNDVHIGTPASVIEDPREVLLPSVVKIALTLYQDDMGKAHYFSRSPIPSGEGPHYHHIGVYSYKRKALERFVSLPPSPLELSEKLEQLRALEDGLRIDVALVNSPPLSVDVPEDLEKLRQQVKG